MLRMCEAVASPGPWAADSSALMAPSAAPHTPQHKGAHPCDRRHLPRGAMRLLGGDQVPYRQCRGRTGPPIPCGHTDATCPLYEAEVHWTPASREICNWPNMPACQPAQGN